MREVERKKKRGSVQDHDSNLFRVDRYSRARGAAHVETEKCRERIEGEESGPHHKDVEELLVLRTNALSNPYVVSPYG